MRLQVPVPVVVLLCRVGSLEMVVVLNEPGEILHVNKFKFPLEVFDQVYTLLSCLSRR